MSPYNEWTILEKLLLTQAVYKYGENMWFQVARVIKQHDLVQLQNIERPPDFYSQKNCSYQYYVLVENLQAESQALRHDIKNDMPVVVRLARHLYLQRVEEIKNHLAQDQKEFDQLATEIHSIRSGDWDHKLKTDSSAVKNTVDAEQAETTPITQNNEHDSGTNNTKENIMSEEKTTTEKQESDNNGAILQENRLKRTSSDVIAHELHLLKRSRLSETNEEEQVLSTAISDAHADTANKEVFEKAVDATYQQPPIHMNVNVEYTLSEKHHNLPTVIQQTEPSDNNAMELENQSFEKQPVDSPQMEEKDEPQSMQHSQLPKIIIPEESPSPLKLNQAHSISPISKSNIQTPEDDDFTGSEVNTPTSNKRNSEQRQKAWQKNINLLWQEIANHKNGTMFMNPIKKSYAPMYDEVVKQPLYLKTIKNRVRDGIVKTTTEFERDIVLMLTNSLMYNKEGTEMYLMAQEMLEDVREQLRLFKSADSFSASFWESEQ